MIRGADISHWQPGTDSLYRNLAKNGRFVIIKASQDTWTDAAFRGHLAGVKGQGLVPGAYHFLTHAVPVHNAPFEASPSPAAQARAFVAAVKSANGGTLDGMLLALDWEPFARKSGGRTVYMSKPRFAQVKEWVQAFRALAPGHPLLIYSRSNVVGSARLDTLPGPVYGWVALWNRTPGAAPRKLGGVPVVIHQFGFLRPMKVDGNAYGGTVAQLRELTRPKAAPAPVPTPEPEPEPAETVWCLRLQGLPLHPTPQDPPCASALYGARLRVAARPSGAGTETDGSPSQAWRRVLAVGPAELVPALVAELPPGAVGPRSPLEPTPPTTSSVKPSPPRSGSG